MLMLDLLADILQTQHHLPHPHHLNHHHQMSHLSVEMMMMMETTMMMVDEVTMMTTLAMDQPESTPASANVEEFVFNSKEIFLV